MGLLMSEILGQGGERIRLLHSNGLAKPNLDLAFPDALEATTRLVPYQMVLERPGAPALRQTPVFVDPGFVEIFPLPMVRGDLAAITKPDRAVISASMAARLFGTADPIGQTLTYCCLGGERFTYRVDGVFQDLPA